MDSQKDEQILSTKQCEERRAKAFPQSKKPQNTVETNKKIYIKFLNKMKRCRHN